MCKHYVIFIALTAVAASCSQLQSGVPFKNGIVCKHYVIFIALTAVAASCSQLQSGVPFKNGIVCKHYVIFIALTMDTNAINVLVEQLFGGYKAGSKGVKKGRKM